MRLDLTSLRVQPPNGREALVIAEFRALDSVFEYTDGLIIDSQRHRERVSVLSAMRQGESRRIAETSRRPVQNLRDECECRNRACAHARCEQ